LLGAAAAVGLVAHAASAEPRTIRTGHWSGGAVKDGGCFVEADYRSAISLVLVWRGDTLVLVMKHDGWSYRPGEVDELTVGVDAGFRRKVRAEATAEHTLRLDFPAGSPFVAALRRGTILKVMRPGAVFRFKLYEIAGALDAIRDCAAEDRP